MKILKLLLLSIGLLPSVTWCAVQITDIKVDNSMFSPNGDGILDSTYVSFTLTTDLGWAAVWIWVTDDRNSTVRTLAVDEAAVPGTVRKGWDGRTASGPVAPEGGYVFRLYARAGEDTTPTFAGGTVLDVSAPAFSPLISPSPYTPDLPMADSLLSVQVLITGSLPEDWLTVSVTVQDLAETLCTRQLDLGDTTYECTWDGRSYDDGVYPLIIRTYDRAGNSSEASYAVDLDTRGPSLGITEPVNIDLNTFPQQAEGFAFDRGGLDSLGFRFQAESGYGPVITEESGDTLYWYVPWPDSLLTDGSYELRIYARDIPGHTATSGKEIAIDTTAPSAPVLSPLPAEVRRPRLEVSGTCSARDSVLLYLNGEIEKRLVCSSGGTFSVEVILADGLNMIQATAKDKAGNLSLPSEAITLTYTRAAGIIVPEMLDTDSVIYITLERPADLITLRVYTLEGYYIASVSNASTDSEYEMTWDLKDSEGEDVRNGVYLLIFEIDYSDGGREVEKKAVLVTR